MMIQQMTREQRADKLGISVEQFDELKAVWNRPFASLVVKAKPVDAKLFDLKHAARTLGITEDQTRGLIQDGELHFIDVGRGKKRPRIRLTEADLDELIERRRRKREQQCQSTNRRSHRSTGSTSKLGAVGFTAQRNAHLAKTAKTMKT